MKDITFKIHKREIAKSQLETAIVLFLNKTDYSSVITLSGAAGNILMQLVLNEGKRPFVDLGRDIANHYQGELLSRSTYKNRMQKLFGISHLKHMSETCDEVLELDLEDCAIKSLISTVHDYTTLFGQDEPFIKAFLNWCWINKDGPGAMEFFNKLPGKFKK